MFALVDVTSWCRFTSRSPRVTFTISMSNPTSAHGVAGNSREQALAVRALKRAQAKEEKNRKAEIVKEEVSLRTTIQIVGPSHRSSRRETLTSRPVDMRRRPNAIRLLVR